MICNLFLRFEMLPFVVGFLSVCLSVCISVSVKYDAKLCIVHIVVHFPINLQHARRFQGGSYKQPWIWDIVNHLFEAPGILFHRVILFDWRILSALNLHRAIGCLLVYLLGSIQVVLFDKLLLDQVLLQKKFWITVEHQILGLEMLRFVRLDGVYRLLFLIFGLRTRSFYLQPIFVIAFTNLTLVCSIS